MKLKDNLKNTQIAFSIILGFLFFWMFFSTSSLLKEIHEIKQEIVVEIEPVEENFVSTAEFPKHCYLMCDNEKIANITFSVEPTYEDLFILFNPFVENTDSKCVIECENKEIYGVN